MSKPFHRYVEVTDAEGSRWRAVITDKMSIREAEAIAIEETALFWGVPQETLEVFVSRKLTDAKYERFRQQMINLSFDPDWWLTKRHHVEVG